MNQIQIFNYNSNQIRTAHKDGEPWFVLKDVCEVLGIGHITDTAKRLESDEVGQTEVIDSLGRKQIATIINESGLYNVILRSDKPEAKPFRKWVTSEVLPSIRKHGAYMTPETLEAAILNPDTMIRVLTALKDEQSKNEALKAQAALDAPKVLFADAAAASHTTILIGDLAKLIRQNGVEIGQKRLFAWMRENGYLIRQEGSSYNMPTQRAMELGLFQVKETAVTHSDGHVTISRTAKVTGKGQTYFVEKFLSKKLSNQNELSVN